MQLKSYAKINLTLNILEKRPDNYHNISSIMNQIDLHDILKFKKIKNDIIVDCKEISEKENIVYKTAFLLKKKYKVKDGIKIKIKKKIPIAAGLAGGSSDAATTLYALNKLWKLNLSFQDLLDTSLELGSDVPFCLTGHTCLVKGRGELILKLKNLPKIPLILINPNIKVSTKEAYSLIKSYKKINQNDILEAIQKSDLSLIAKNIFNDFEPIIEKKYPIINEIKKDLTENKALAAQMSGSGPTIFAIFKNKKEQKKAYKSLKNKYKKIYLTNTI